MKIVGEKNQCTCWSAAQKSCWGEERYYFSKPSDLWVLWKKIPTNLHWRRHVFFGWWSIAVAPNKSEFFVHLSWSVDIWAKINDVMRSQTVSSCVTGSPPSPQITKEQLGRNRQWRSQTPTFTPIQTLSFSSRKQPMQNLHPQDSPERSTDSHRIGALIIYNILNISCTFACHLHVA